MNINDLRDDFRTIARRMIHDRIGTSIIVNRRFISFVVSDGTKSRSCLLRISTFEHAGCALVPIVEYLRKEMET